MEKPKVVARLALQGDENIASVAMSKDGGLLAVATAREVKLFQLVQGNSDGSSNLRIRKLEANLTDGAKLIQFTPDGKWLALITAANTVFLARIIRTDDPTERPRALPKLLRLQRLQRDPEPNPLDGPSGPYTRSISHAEFSSDGSIFAVADLAGYIDTWVTEGHEDFTALEVDVDETSSSADNDDDSDDEDSEPKRVTFLGQRWIRNPSAHLIPRVDSKPVLLSFQPNPEAQSRPEPNGNPAVHPTRQNPHPHSHEIPEIEHRLLVVSANHQLNLFDVLAGRLSEWSRRNPLSSYPQAYRILMSPAKGCLWDTAGQQQRVWLYGEAWLFMFDLSQDLPISETTEDGEGKPSKKRKRDNMHKGPSGAGGTMPESMVPVSKMRRFQSSGKDDKKNAEITNRNHWEITGSSSDDDEAADDDHAALTALRRGASKNGSNAQAEDTDMAVAVIKDDDGADTPAAKARQENWWYTMKYRPILGIVPVGGGGGGDRLEGKKKKKSEHQPLEVMLVERPVWDLDVPPRFAGIHE